MFQGCSDYLPFVKAMLETDDKKSISILFDRLLELIKPPANEPEEESEQQIDEISQRLNQTSYYMSHQDLTMYSEFAPNTLCLSQLKMTGLTSFSKMNTLKVVKGRKKQNGEEVVSKGKLRKVTDEVTGKEKLVRRIVVKKKKKRKKNVHQATVTSIVEAVSSEDERIID